MVLTAAGAAFIASFVVVLTIERRASAFGLIDRPNHRSSHAAPRPRGGGVGILCGVAAGLAIVALDGTRFDGAVWTMLAASFAVALAGLCDDISPIAPLPRLGVHVAAAGVVVWTCGGLLHMPLPAPMNVVLGVLGPLLAMVWIVGVTNFFNFMDGADGLAGGQACITFAALAWVLWPLPLSVVALVSAAAVAAFLMRNWAPAKIFLGDVGSGWVGFVLAAVPFAGPTTRRGDLLLFVATSLALFLVDPSVTLLRRWLGGKPVMASHREHAYQRLFDPRDSHVSIVSGILAASAVLTCVAAVAYARPAWGWWSLAAAVTAAAIEWWVAPPAAKTAS